MSEDGGINRIRLEFKGKRLLPVWNVLLVLIESDWNLKVRLDSGRAGKRNGINRIRLEFKASREYHKHFSILVLIESDWNLK